MNTAHDRVTEALHAHGSAQKGKDWTCPSHDDSTPSLSVTEGATGVVLHCHAGCPVEQVVQTLGLTMSDLFDEPVKKAKGIVATYDYTSVDGQLLYQVVRYDPKEFRQRAPNGRGGWRWSLSGIQRVLYRLPDIATAIANGQPIYITEGEKDADAFFERGAVATTNSGGAGSWREEYAQTLANADVIIVADKDGAGQLHAIEVSESLESVASSTRIVEPKTGKDASDHFNAGYGLEDFPDGFITPITEPPPPSDNPMWVRILDTNKVDDIPPPTYLIDKLVAADTLVVVYGLPGSCKSFLTMDWALSVANHQNWMNHQVQGGDVFYVVAEGLAGVGIRKKAWQKARGISNPSGVKWYPEPVNLLDSTAVSHLTEVIEILQPVMVVIDTLARSMPGADENSPAPMSRVIETVDILRRSTKGAIVLNHHTPKDGGTIRGHGSLEGAIQTGIKLVKEDHSVKLTVEKQKDDEPIEMNLTLRKVLDSAVLYPEVNVATEPLSVMGELEITRVMAETVGPDGLSTAALLRLSGMTERTFRRSLKGLEFRGRIHNIGTDRQTRWVLVE